LSFAIGLQMFDKAGYMFDAEAGVELSEFFVYELSAIVGYDRKWDAIATHDIFPNELLDLLSCASG